MFTENYTEEDYIEELTRDLMQQSPKGKWQYEVNENLIIEFEV